MWTLKLFGQFSLMSQFHNGLTFDEKAYLKRDI
jgi:hypothetical protein